MMPKMYGDADIFKFTAPALKPMKTFGSEMDQCEATPSDALNKLSSDSTAEFTAKQHARVAKYGK